MNAAAAAALSAWILSYFALHASPPPACAPPACTQDVLAERAHTYDARDTLARAYLAVAFDPGEPPLFKHGPHVRARTALRLAAIAAHESGVKPHLVAGQCWPGECPGGSVGPLQILVPPGGFVVQGDWLRPCRPLDEHCIEAVDIADSHELAARVALRILRWGGLVGYTGHGPGNPAIAWIEQTSQAFLASHPPPLTDAAAAAEPGLDEAP